MKNDRLDRLSKARRVVLKVGSSLLTDRSKKRIRAGFLRSLSQEVLYLQRKGVQCLVVTSGAIAAGLFEMGLEQKPKEMGKLQALAAVGQSSLMHAYEMAFKKQGLKVAQILLTREDLEDRQRYSNAHNTIMELFRHKIIPIVNENDTVAVEEIKFGNNDILGTLVTHMIQGDLLVLLTDTDGFYEEDPRLNPRARLIPEVRTLDPSVEGRASRSLSGVGTGGMHTKIQAAKKMMASGVPVIIANGDLQGVLRKIWAGKSVGTFFHPLEAKMSSRKNWLAWSAKPKGDVMVDEGAQRALQTLNKSLLPAGVLRTEGEWQAGDMVRILGPGGLEIARGMCRYSSKDLEAAKGSKTQEIRKRLGNRFPEEAIHRDDLVKSMQA